MPVSHVQFLTVPVADRGRARDFPFGGPLDVEVDDPEGLPWGRTTTVEDPDGNRIDLLQASEYGNWPR